MAAALVVSAVAGACRKTTVEYAPVPPQETTTTVASGPVDGSPSAAASGEPANEDRRNYGNYVNGHHVVLLTSIGPDQGWIQVDVVQWLDDSEASRAYAEDNNGDTIDGEEFYIRNQSKELRSFDVAQNAIGLLDPVADRERKRLSFPEFVRRIDDLDPSRSSPYGITLREGLVTRIERIYTP